MKIYIHNLKNKVGSTRAARLDFASRIKNKKDSSVLLI